MRGLVLHGPQDIRLEEVEDPRITAINQAIVDVTLAGLCGSDLHPYLGREPARPGVVQGHEAVGVITNTGSGVTRFRPGDHVLVPFTTSCGTCGPCRRRLSSRCTRGRLFGWGDPGSDEPALHGGQAERLVVPDADGTLVAIPDGMDDATALLLADNLPTAWYAVDRSSWVEGPLVVLGLGAVGFCAVAVADQLGRGDVIAADLVEDRRAALAGHGITVVHPDELEDLLPDGAAAVIDAAGPPAAQRTAAAIVRAGGTISMIAVQTESQFGFDPVTVYDKNLTVRSGRAPVRSLLDRLLPDVMSGALAVPPVITHPDRDLSEGPELYAAFAEQRIGKATFRMSPASPA